MEQIYIPKQDYKVLVRCFTYNQSKYIEDALKGFAMQQTEFPFVCLVMDDCSTDGEQEVIKAWMNRECDMSNAECVEIEKSYITIVPHKSNKQCTFACYFLKQNMYKVNAQKMDMVDPWRKHCVYEAICEGDDYWIAEDKLQKQVEILERDNTVNVVYTKSKIYLQSKKKFSKEIGGSAYKGYEAQLLKEPIMTLTSIVRINALENYYEEISPDTKGWLMGDTPMWLWMSNHGKIYFMDEVTSVYRHLDNSASHSKSYDALESYNKSLLDIRLYFLDLYPVETPNIKTCIYDDFYRRNIAQALFTNSFHQVFANLGHLSNSNCLDYVKATIKIVIKLVKKQIDKDV